MLQAHEDLHARIVGNYSVEYETITKTGEDTTLGFMYREKSKKIAIENIMVGTRTCAFL